MNKPNNMRRRASRDRIETAFVRLLQDRELSSLSVTEICKAADVNRTTFYANYIDIYDLADAGQGGGAGINLCPDFLGLTRDVDAVCAHIEHFLALGGGKAVFLGADLDGIDDTPRGLEGAQDLGKIYEALLRRNHP